jgi:hypothetical protein
MVEDAQHSFSALIGLAIVIAFVVFLVRGLKGWYQDARGSGERKSPVRGIAAVVMVSGTMIASIYLMFTQEFGLLLKVGLLFLVFIVFGTTLHWLLPTKTNTDQEPK